MTKNIPLLTLDQKYSYNHPGSLRNPYNFHRLYNSIHSGKLKKKKFAAKKCFE